MNGNQTSADGIEYDITHSAWTQIPQTYEERPLGFKLKRSKQILTQRLDLNNEFETYADKMRDQNQ